MPDYTIQPGDNPWKLAERLYGEGRWAIEILRQNPGASWVGGTVISLPDQGAVRELQDTGFKPLITNEQAAYLGTGMSNFGTRPFDEMGRPTGTVTTLGGGGANTGGTGVGSTLGFANARTAITNPADRVRTEYGIQPIAKVATAAAGSLGGAVGTRRIAGQRVSPGASGMSTPVAPTISPTIPGTRRVSPGGTAPLTRNIGTIPAQDLAMRGRGMGRAPETRVFSSPIQQAQASRWQAEQTAGAGRARTTTASETPPASSSGVAYSPVAPSGQTAKLDEIYNALESMTPPDTITTSDVEDLFQNYYRTTVDPTTGAPVTITRQQFARAMESMGYTLDLTSKTWTRGSEITEIPDLLSTPAGTEASGAFNLFDTPVWYSAITRMLSQSGGGGGGSSTGRSDTSMPYYAKVGGTTWNTGR